MRERLDAMALNDEKIDTSEYCRLTNSLRRVLTTLGLQRVPRDVTDLRGYIEGKAKRVRIDDDDDEAEDAA